LSKNDKFSYKNKDL